MLFCIIVSFLAGYILNEEASLQRICTNLSHPHLGWCLLRDQLVLWVIVLYFIIAFLKSWMLAVLLRDNLGLFWGLPAGIYVIGNILAAARGKSFFYTPWIVLMGILLARNVVVFQGSLTAFSAILVLTRNISLSVDIWLLTMIIFILVFIEFPESICWLAIIALTYIFSKETFTNPGLSNKII